MTSLGFGHVSGLIALVHPQAFLAALDPEQREAYQAAGQARMLAGQRRLASAIAGGTRCTSGPHDRRLRPRGAGEARRGGDVARSGVAGSAKTACTRGERLRDEQ